MRSENEAVKLNLLVHYGEKLQIHRNDENKAQQYNEKYNYAIIQLCYTVNEQ